MAGKSFYVSHLLKGQPVEFRETDDDEWEIHYGPLLVGHLLIRQGKARVAPDPDSDHLPRALRRRPPGQR